MGRLIIGKYGEFLGIRNIWFGFEGKVGGKEIDRFFSNVYVFF